MQNALRPDGARAPTGGGARVWAEIDSIPDIDVTVCTLHHENVTLNSDTALAEWQRQVDAALARFRGTKVYLLIDLRGVVIDPGFANRYGLIAKQVVAKYARGVFRYGHAQGMTAATVRLQAIIHKFPSNVFADRAAAIAALRRSLGLSD